MGTPVSAPVASTQYYAYDRYGNRAVLEPSMRMFGNATPSIPGNTPPANFAAAVEAIYPQNRLNGMGYDSGGFITGMDGKTLEYDVEGRLTKHVSGGATMTYSYDGEGRRVKAEQSGTSSSVTTYVYGVGGELVAEYGGTVPGNGVTFLTADHLGSTRLVTKESGTAADIVASRHDYLPFGEEIPRGAGYGGGPTQKFTGKERDAETGLDYFGARYMASAQGRFTSPDAPFADQYPEDPQSWNLYGYARNNPLLFIDPTGQAIRLTGTTQAERDEELEALRASVGNGKVAGQIQAYQDKKTGDYMVKVTGDTKKFAKSGEAASNLLDVVNNKEVANFGVVGSVEPLALSTSSGNTLSDIAGAGNRATGVTGRDSSGQLWIYAQSSKENYGTIEGSKFIQKGPFDGLLGVWSNQGTTTAHELGHGYYNMLVGPGQNNPNISNAFALKFENANRRNNPGWFGTPIRVRH